MTQFSFISGRLSVLGPVTLKPARRDGITTAVTVMNIRKEGLNMNEGLRQGYYVSLADEYVCGWRTTRRESVKGKWEGNREMCSPLTLR